MTRIHLSPPHVTDVERDLVLDALDSGWIAPLGPHVDAFEQEMAERVGVQHALALSSGTAALHLALLALGAGPDTVVVLPSMTFGASAWPVRYCGAEPLFVDSGPDANLDVELFIDAVDKARTATDSVLAMSVDLFGRCADYDALVPVLAERGVPLVEDAAEAVGAGLGERAAGSFGRAGVFSFNGNKIMTTSGGGMLLSDDGDLVAHARYLSTQARQPVLWYEHTEVGYNYRLSNLLAAVGRGQLRRLDEMVARRRAIRERYAAAVAELPGVSILGRGLPRSDEQDNCWLTCILLDPAEARADRDGVIAALEAAEIESRPLWKPMHMQPVFAGARAFVTGTAERLFDTGVALPSGSGMSDDDLDRVIGVLEEVLGA